MLSPGGWVLAFALVGGAVLSTADADATSPPPSASELVTREDIQTYFTLKRKQHLEAVQTLIKFNRYEQKYEMLRRIYEKIFEVLETSRAKVENSEYILGGELPKTDVVEHVLQVLDNCAFFGNLVLKLPDISDRLVKANTKWIDSYSWCFTFSASANLLDETSLKMFNLAAQQLNLVPKDPDFVNPYEEKAKKKKKTKKGGSSSESSAKGTAKKKSKEKRSKGPRLSKVEL